MQSVSLGRAYLQCDVMQLDWSSFHSGADTRTCTSVPFLAIPIMIGVLSCCQKHAPVDLLCVWSRPGFGEQICESPAVLSCSISMMFRYNAALLVVPCVLASCWYHFQVSCAVFYWECSSICVLRHLNLCFIFRFGNFFFFKSGKKNSL